MDNLVKGLLAGVFIGAPIGYLIAERLVTDKYEGRIEKEVLAARDLNARMNKIDQYATPEQAVKALHNYVAVDDEGKYSKEDLAIMEKVMQQRGIKPSEGPVELTGDPILVEGEPMNRNVFEDNNGIVDEGKRDPDKPYIISVDEYSEDVKYEKISLTYYKGDDTLTDDHDDPIPDIDSLVGQDSLDKFGHGSTDKHIVFVRNEQREADYEIYCDERKFTEAVLGIPPEDDARARPRKMRQDD